MCKFDFLKFQETPLNTIIKNPFIEAIILMKFMLKYNPEDRPTASEWLNDSYFNDVRQYLKMTYR